MGRIVADRKLVRPSPASDADAVDIIELCGLERCKVVATFYNVFGRAAAYGCAIPRQRLCRVSSKWLSGKWCCWTGLNCRPLHYQWSALPLSYSSEIAKGAADSSGAKIGAAAFATGGLGVQGACCAKSPERGENSRRRILLNLNLIPEHCRLHFDAD